METQKILVTGGKGFIGTNLVSELERRGHDVWVCDIGQSEGEKYIRCDVGKYRQAERMFDGADRDFDYVYHLAAEYVRWNGEDYYENLWMNDQYGRNKEHTPDSGEKEVQNDLLQFCRGLWGL